MPLDPVDLLDFARVLCDQGFRSKSAAEGGDSLENYCIFKHYLNPFSKARSCHLLLGWYIGTERRGDARRQEAGRTARWANGEDKTRDLHAGGLTSTSSPPRELDVTEGNAVALANSPFESSIFISLRRRC